MTSRNLTARQTVGMVLVLLAAFGTVAYLWWYQTGPFAPTVPGETQAPPLRGLRLQQIVVGLARLERTVTDFAPARTGAPPQVTPAGGTPVLGTARPGETPERKLAREMQTLLHERLAAGGVPFRPLEPGEGLVRDFDSLSVAIHNTSEGGQALFQVKAQVRRTVFLVGQRLPSEAIFPLVETPVYRVPRDRLLPCAAEAIRAMADSIVQLYKTQNGPPPTLR